MLYVYIYIHIIYGRCNIHITKRNQYLDFGAVDSAQEAVEAEHEARDAGAATDAMVRRCCWCCGCCDGLSPMGPTLGWKIRTCFAILLIFTGILG